MAPRSSSQRLLALLLTLLALQACSKTSSPQSPIAEYAGRWVVINYWAEWCGPCIEEIPELNALQQEYADEIAVLGVNFDHISGDALPALAAKMGINFTNLATDPADALRLSRPNALPTTYLFDPAGTLAAVLVGPQTSDALLERMNMLRPGSIAAQP